MLSGFQIVSLTVGLPSMSITKNGITFNKTAIYKLEKADFVILLINREIQQIAVQKCTPETRDCISFYKPGGRYVTARINNSDFMATIAKMMNWDIQNKGYKIIGDFLPEELAIVFDLRKATILR